VFKIGYSANIHLHGGTAAASDVILSENNYCVLIDTIDFYMIMSSCVCVCVWGGGGC
jgi:hypothetical protein